jgi:hypothetical protein
MPPQTPLVFTNVEEWESLKCHARWAWWYDTDGREPGRNIMLGKERVILPLPMQKPVGCREYGRATWLL